MDVDVVALLTVPLFTGAIGYVTNWSGVWMLFQPVQFRGWRFPGLALLVKFLPRKVQQIPGVMHGAVGWQGIIPSRAAKMGSLAVDKGIAKLGSPAEFYTQLDPELIAEHVLQTARADMHDVVERTMAREHPALWRDMPPRLRERLHERVQEQLPVIVRTLMHEIGDNIDHLLDIKLMVIRRMEANPALANTIFRSVGEQELKFIVNFGFWFGLALGVPVAIITEVLFHAWWLLPILGVIVGYVTNLLAIVMIFEPAEPRRILGMQLARAVPAPPARGRRGLRRDHRRRHRHGLQHRRGADERAALGPHAPPDRDRDAPGRRQRERLVAAGGARGGRHASEYDAIRDSVAAEAVDYTITPLSDPEFNRRQAAAVKGLVAERMKEMPPRDFTEMLRTAIKEDEWLLYLHGAVLGFGAGLVHLAIFG